jgi:ABC-type antimicrobial peptide transport system permease subunit
MFKNFFTTALRNLKRNKAYSLINIIGLGVGMAICLMIFLIIHFETSFDTFHSQKERIYRVLTEFNDPSGKSFSAGVPFPLPATLRQDFPQLEKVAPIYADNNTLLSVMDEDNQKAIKKFKEEEGVFFTEASFFEIFDFKWLSGDPATALSDPLSIVLTKEIAEKYFGSWEAAIGKTINRNNKKLLKVTGILESIPRNTDFQFKAVAPYKTFMNPSDDWTTVSSNHVCYVLLPQTIKPGDISKLFPAFVKKYRPEERASTTGQVLQSIADVHYDSDSGNFLGRTISRELTSTIKLIAVFILLIACVNFINLSTAQSINRAKEVSVRKVLGSNKRQLAFQFLSETTLITIGAAILAVLLVITSLPFIKSVLDLPLSFSIQDNPGIVLFLLGITIAVILLSGFYPSIILSRFNPVTALKSKFNAGRTRGISLRRGLVVIQFVIAQALIIGTFIIVKQMNYFQNASLGYDKEAILTVPIPPDSMGRSKIEVLKARLLQRPEIKSVSFSFAPPSSDGNWYSDFKFDHGVKNTEFAANLKWADADYVTTYKLPFIAGRNYAKGDTATEVLVNEELLKSLGIRNPAEAIGKEINMWDGQVKASVVGVLKNFNSQSLQEAMAPVIIGNYKNTYRLINLKLQQQNMQQTLAYIEKLWNQTYPQHVYEYQFIDEIIANFYRQEKQLSQLYKIFAFIAIFLSCLGLYGLASFMAVQRIKEVGIRKVLGATVQHLVYLFTKEFIGLIAVAFLIAMPLAWYFMNGWLEGFAYRIAISWWIFLAAGFLSLFVALITVCSQAIKAAIANPVKSLRTE